MPGQNPGINAGDLDKRVTLLSPVYNPAGDEIVDWLPVADVWAAVEPAFGMEQTQSSREVAVTDVLIRIRYRADIDPRWQIRLRAKTFQVRSLLNVVERNEQLHMNCREVQ